nr:esterase-like activity of phytase family protein [Oculatellaceae cyanobacterium Prado106]
PDGNPYAKGTVDPEGIALSPRQTLYISSEGVSRDQIPPFVNEYDLQTGQYRSRLPIPQRFLPQTLDDQPAGVQDNRGFEALTLSAVGFSGGQQLEPFRIFTAPEFGLLQDQPPQPEDSATALPPTPIRFLHYLVGVGNNAPSEIISEHLYDLDLPPEGTRDYGLSELLVLDQAGHFLSLERSFGLSGFGAKLFQIATGGATDTSTLPNLRDSIEGITPIRKELLLDLTTLGLPLDNLEGMTLGPQLPDGSQSLLLASDDNFNDIQVTQFLLFRLKGWRSQ